MEKLKRFVVKHKRLLILLCIALVFVVWKLVGPKTLEKGNGYKHQIGSFNKECDGYKCPNTPIHRIYHVFGSDYYCEECWVDYGESQFRSLAHLDRKNIYSDEAADAKICAVKAVKDQLKSPSTAEFCKYTEMTATNLGGDRWKITGWVDAQNSFGATIRENWTVTLTLTGSGFKDASVTFN